MNRNLQVFVLILLITGVSACAPAVPAAEQAASTPTKAAPTEGYYPLATRTGVEDIDIILDAARGDAAALRPLIQFTEAKCTLAEGLGGPPKCREGEAEGTPVEVLPFLGSEGSFLRANEIGNWEGINVSGLYAVYQVSTDLVGEEYSPAGEYAIVFAGDENQPGTILRLANGRIVRIDSIFDVSTEALHALLARESARIILAPPAQ